MKIHEQNKALKVTNVILEDSIDFLIKYLSGPKFTGTEVGADGKEYSKDYVPASEVVKTLRSIVRDSLIPLSDEIPPFDNKLKEAILELKAKGESLTAIVARLNTNNLG